MDLTGGVCGFNMEKRIGRKNRQNGQGTLNRTVEGRLFKNGQGSSRKKVALNKLPLNFYKNYGPIKSRGSRGL